MARARKCDRCNKYYDNNERYKTHNYGEKIVGIRFEGSGNVDRPIDLCDDCLGELINFLGFKVEDYGK